ncbi:MAG: hypothetical protein ACFFCH_10945 [Promethearchaeota archaeon]
MTDKREHILRLEKLEWLNQLALQRHADHIKRKEVLDNKALTLAGVVGTGLTLIMGFAPIILSLIPAGSILLIWVTAMLLFAMLTLVTALLCALWAGRTIKYFLSPDIAHLKKKIDELTRLELLEKMVNRLAKDIQENMLKTEQNAKWLLTSFVFAIIGFSLTPIVVFLVFSAIT